MTQVSAILAALADGAATSRDMAARLRADRRCISVALCKLAEVGRIERAGVANLGQIGRPFVRWRLRRVATAPSRPQRVSEAEPA